MASLGRLTITRAQAKERGLKRYYTGKPCKRGHVCERYVSAGCLDCLAENLKRWRKENPEKRKEQDRRARDSNGAQIRKNHSAWRARNPNWDAEYYKRKKKQILQTSAEWKKNNPDKVAAMSRNRKALERNAEGKHTAADVRRLFLEQGGLCAVCCCKLKKTGPQKFHVDHVVPISKGGSNWPDNLQILCPPCNLSKNAKDPEQWMMEIASSG